jgi:hypothetical protein
MGGGTEKRVCDVCEFGVSFVLYEWVCGLMSRTEQ